jgi:hypothetical protein
MEWSQYSNDRVRQWHVCAMASESYLEKLFLLIANVEATVATMNTPLEITVVAVSPGHGWDSVTNHLYGSGGVGAWVVGARVIGAWVVGVGVVGAWVIGA